jgi:hypothetical protein
MKTHQHSASRLRKLLSEQDIHLSHAQSIQMFALIHGYPSWDQFAEAIPEGIAPALTGVLEYLDEFEQADYDERIREGEETGTHVYSHRATLQSLLDSLTSDIPLHPAAPIPAFVITEIIEGQVNQTKIFQDEEQARALFVELATTNAGVTEDECLALEKTHSQISEGSYTVSFTIAN